MTAFDFTPAGQAQEEDKPPFWQTAMSRFIDIEAALSGPPPVLDFVIPGLLAGTVGAVVSQGGVGKSNMTLQVAASVATGLDLLGFGKTSPDWKPGEPGRVVFLTAEDPAEILTIRLRSLVSILHRHVGGGHDEVREYIDLLIQNLEIIPLVGLLPDLMNGPQTDELKPMVDSSRLIVVDTLRRFHRLPEADDGSMAQLVGTLETLTQSQYGKPALLYLHHVNKTSSREGGAGDQTASRGSSVLVDNARFQLNLVPMSLQEAKAVGMPEEQRTRHLRAVRSKSNYTAPLPDLWFKRDVGGMLWPIDSPLIDSAEDEQPESRNRYEEQTRGDMKAWPTRRKAQPVATVNGVNGGAW